MEEKLGYALGYMQQQPQSSDVSSSEVKDPGWLTAGLTCLLASLATLAGAALVGGAVFLPALALLVEDHSLHSLLTSGGLFFALILPVSLLLTFACLVVSVKLTLWLLAKQGYAIPDFWQALCAINLASLAAGMIGGFTGGMIAIAAHGHQDLIWSAQIFQILLGALLSVVTCGLALHYAKQIPEHLASLLGKILLGVCLLLSAGVLILGWFAFRQLGL